MGDKTCWAPGSSAGTIPCCTGRPSRALSMALVVGLLCIGGGTSEDDECLRGDELRHAGDVRAALAAYKSCVAQGGGNAATRHNLGVALMEEGALRESRAHFERALELQPILAASYAGIGQAFEAEDRCREAVSFYQQAIAVTRVGSHDADQFRAILLGALLRCSAVLIEAKSHARGTQDANKAADMLADAVPCMADVANWQLWLKLGTVALHLQRFHEATLAFRTCIRLGGAGNRGDEDDCHFGAAICASQNMQHVASASLFEGASRRQPSPRHALALVGAFLQHAKAFSWGEVGQERSVHHQRREQLVKALGHSYLTLFSKGGIPPWALVQPHELLLLDVGGQLFRSLAAAYAAGLAGRDTPKVQAPLHLPLGAQASGMPMVVGYVSSDFSAHATTHLLKGVFALHDKRSISAVCLDLQGGVLDGAGREWHVQVGRDCRLRPVTGSSEEGAAVIRNEGVQVLVDLNGWTAGHRGDVLAQRAAPVQALYLGYPGTTGAGFMDYFISDAKASPPELASHYAEKLLLLPDCYYVNDHARYHEEEARASEHAGAAGSAGRRAHTRHARSSAGLPPDATVIANFNQLYKITPDVFASWIRAVAQDEAGVFWQTMPLDSPSAPGAVARLKAAAGKHGLASSRMLLTNNTNIVEFVRRCGLADIVLDTYPITAHTVAMDVLWMGTPLLTRTGESFSSRVATSVLSALGLHGILAARTQDDWRLLAERFLQEPAGRWRRQRIRRVIERRRWTWPLFNRKLQVQGLETAFRLMWEIHAAGIQPRHVVLSALDGPRAPATGT